MLVALVYPRPALPRGAQYQAGRVTPARSVSHTVSTTVSRMSSGAQSPIR